MIHFPSSGSRSLSVLRRVTAIAIIAFLVTACGGAAAPTATPEPTPVPPLRLGLSLSDLSNPFFVTLRDGAQQAADRLGVTLVVAADSAENPDTQAAEIQALIDQGVDALLINPVDTAAIVPSIEAANAAGIPVFTIDRSAGGGEIVSHIASDNLAGGRMAGNYLAETLREAGNVVELRGIEGTSAARERGQGFNEAMAAYANITIIASETANFNQEEARAVFAAILEEYPDIDGVFAHNDNMILGAIEAAREAGRLEGIRFVGFDAIDAAVAAVEAGDLLATIAQQPGEMGRLGVEVAVRYLNGETVAASIPVDLALIAR
jgi:ribose transport system substrate-binding protein